MNLLQRECESLKYSFKFFFALLLCVFHKVEKLFSPLNNKLLSEENSFCLSTNLVLVAQHAHPS